MDSGDEDEMSMAQRDWERMKGSLEKSGYRDGIGRGETDNLQKYTDQSREVCQVHFEAIGKLQGLILVHLCKCSEESTGSSEDAKTLETILHDLKTYVDNLPTSGILEPESNMPADTTFTDFLKTKALELDANLQKYGNLISEALGLSFGDFDKCLRQLNPILEKSS